MNYGYQLSPVFRPEDGLSLPLQRMSPWPDYARGSPLEEWGQIRLAFQQSWYFLNGVEPPASPELAPLTVAVAGLPPAAAEGDTLSLTASVAEAGPAAPAVEWLVFRDGLLYATGAGPGLTFAPDDEGEYLVIAHAFAGGRVRRPPPSG